MQELSVFVSHGWHVQGPETYAPLCLSRMSEALSQDCFHMTASLLMCSASSHQYSVQPPQLGVQITGIDASMSQAAKDLGVVEDATACACWRLPRELSNTDENVLQSVERSLRFAVAAVAAGRVAACALQHSGWCLAPLQTLEAMMSQLKASTKDADLWLDGGVQSPAALALKAAVSALEEPFHTCLEILDDFRPPNATKIDTESVVFLIANLDSMYYVLLDHHLTAPWTPSVPPPHRYFPAVLDVMKPEVKAAVSALLQRSGSEASTAFRKAWGLSEDNTFESEADPLRQVCDRLITALCLDNDWRHLCCASFNV